MASTKFNKEKGEIKINNINILFVCKYNIFRSKVAEAYFNKINKNKNIKAKSAGLITGGMISEKQITAVKNFRLNLKDKSKGLNTKLLKWQDVIVIVADNVPPKIFSNNKKYGKKVIVWKIKDTMDKEGKDIPRIIKKITKKVNELNKAIEKDK